VELEESKSHAGHDEHRHDEHSHHAHHIGMFKKRFWLSLVLTAPILLLSEMIQAWFGFRIDFVGRRFVLLVFASVVYFYGGWPFITGAMDEIRKRAPGMMTLIGTAISVAFFYSAATVVIIGGKDFFWELATLIDVMLLGHWIEAKSVLGASRALEELVKVMPTTAHMVRNGEISDVPVSELKVGDVVLTRPGEKIPSDGEVIEGESFVNEALLTGESKPIHKRQGDEVIGGAINAEGSLKVRIKRTGKETYLAQVVELVRRAQESRSRTQDMANKAAALLFYVALAAGIATYIVWFFARSPDFALERAVTVLVIACPHALGLAIPLVVALSTSITAKNGILIRDRRAFEGARNTTAVVFDKTGTLTEGKFGVSDVVAFIDEAELLKLAAGVEINSEHVIAKAIVEHVKDNNIAIPQSEGFKAIPGKGAYARVAGNEVYVCGPNLISDMNIEATKTERIGELQAQGKTVVFAVTDGKLAGAFALADTIKKEASEAVKALKSLGIKVFMLTGDAEEVASWVSEELGIDDYFAQVLPHEKAEKIELLKSQGYKVAMVGDGINDAPALVTADVGIAIGAGTDVAIESADIILVKSDPNDVAKAIDISKRTYAKMLQNLWWAAGYNIAAIPLAAGVLFGVGFFLPPALGALVMSISTVIVALNTQTLRRYEPEGGEIVEKKHITKDPVCGMEIAPDAAYSKIEHENYVLYFCSANCERQFKESPETHVAKISEGGSEADKGREHHH